jgi:hypothetical protein
MVLAQQEVIGHACDVIADHSVARLVLRLLGVVPGHPVGMDQKEAEQSIERCN